MQNEFKEKNTIGTRQSFFLKIHPDDNVLVALKDLLTELTYSSNGSSFKLAENVAAKHKFFEHDMSAGDDVIMYGVLVGQVAVKCFKRTGNDHCKYKTCCGKICLPFFSI